MTEAIEVSLWDTLRAIEERILILRQIEAMARAEGAKQEADAAGTRAKVLDDRVERLRRLLQDDAVFDNLSEA